MWKPRGSESNKPHGSSRSESNLTSLPVAHSGTFGEARLLTCRLASSLAHRKNTVLTGFLVLHRQDFPL